MKEKIDVFTTSDVASICGVDSSSVLNWIKSGKLKSYQTIGKHHRILKSDLMSFVQENGLPFLGKIPRPEVSKKRVLIVDDDRDFSKLLSKTLNQEDDWNIFSVNTVMEASLKVGSWQPDVIILDIVLPDVNGLDFFGFLKNNADLKKTPVILITGQRKTLEEKEGLRKMGVVGYFEKPFVIPDLIQKIRSVFV